MVVGSPGESRAQHLSHSRASAIASGKIRVAAGFLGPGLAQSRADRGAELLKIRQLRLAFDFDAERGKAFDQECLMLILRENERVWKRREALSQIPDGHPRGLPRLD